MEDKEILNDMEEFLELLDRYADARIERDKCYNSCGYDAGYFCYQENEKVDELKTELSAMFCTMVISCVEKANGG